MFTVEKSMLIVMFLDVRWFSSLNLKWDDVEHIIVQPFIGQNYSIYRGIGEGRGQITTQLPFQVTMYYASLTEYLSTQFTLLPLRSHAWRNSPLDACLSIIV